MYGNVISKLQVADRAGVIKEIADHPVPGTTEITGKVSLSGLGLMGLAVDGNAITLSSGQANATPNQDLLDLYNDWSSGATPLPFLVSFANAVASDTGQIMLPSGKCMQAGLLEDKSGLAYVVDADHTLSLADLCPPCQDCEDYQRVYERLQAVSGWIASNHRANFDDDATPQQLTPITKLFRQYQAMLYYWNYLVQSQSYILMLRAEGAFVRGWFGYYNSNCDLEDPAFYLNVLMDRYQREDCVDVSANIMNVDIKSNGVTAFTVNRAISTSDTPSVMDYHKEVSTETGTLTVQTVGAVGSASYYNGTTYVSIVSSVELNEGIYSIEFDAVAGYITPYKRWVYVPRGGNVVVSGVYVPDTEGDLPWATFVLEVDGTMTKGDYVIAEVLVRFLPSSDFNVSGFDCEGQILGQTHNHVVGTGYWVNVFDGQVVQRIKEAEPEVAQP